VGQVAPLPSLPYAGVVLAGLGLALVLAAVMQMVAARTTFVPRRDPDALVSSGLFRVSRNPIYLGDALILVGLCLYWNAVLALPLVIIFVRLISRRFIEGEEAVLRHRFGSAFDTYAKRTRRWI